MAVDRGVIDAQLRDIGEGERWWEEREFRDLPHVLHAGERILGLVHGKLLGPRRPRLRPARTWLLVATDQRLICLRQERLTRRQIEFAAGQIRRIDRTSGVRTDQIAIQTSERRYRLRIPKDDAFRFATALAPLEPERPSRQLPPDLEALSWIPGMATIASLPPIAGLLKATAPVTYEDRAPRDVDRVGARIEKLEATAERLQSEVEKLREHVAFLEELLEERPSRRARESPPARTAGPERVASE